MPNELLPTNIGFGTVVGRFGSAPLIAGDADGFPDFSPAAGLTVTFTPSTAAVIDATASPAPVTIEMVPIVCGLDSQGYLVGGDGQRGVKLIATDDTDINPSGWTYSVTFLRAGAKVAAFRDFSMSLPQGVTKDIALTIPVPSSSGVSLSQAQAAEAAAVSAASQASISAAGAEGARVAAVAATSTKVDKGSSVVNVRDYGAACNGTTDDTAAIQAALNTGKDVEITNGSVKITAQLKLTTVAQRFITRNASIKPSHVGDSVLITQPNQHVQCVFDGVLQPNTGVAADYMEAAFIRIGGSYGASGALLNPKNASVAGSVCINQCKGNGIIWEMGAHIDFSRFDIQWSMTYDGIRAPAIYTDNNEGYFANCRVSNVGRYGYWIGFLHDDVGGVWGSAAASRENTFINAKSFGAGACNFRIESRRNTGTIYSENGANPDEFTSTSYANRIEYLATNVSYRDAIDNGVGNQLSGLSMWGMHDSRTNRTRAVDINNLLSGRRRLTQDASYSFLDTILDTDLDVTVTHKHGGTGVRTDVFGGRLSTGGELITSGGLNVSGRVRFNQSARAAGTINLTSNSGMVQRCDATAGNVVLNLPTTGLVNGQTFLIKKVDGTANTVTMAGGTIDGGAGFVLSDRYQCIELMYSGSGTTWDITRRFTEYPTSSPFPKTTGITYNSDGSVATVTESGVTTSYTYNTDGTVATDTRGGITRTYTYDGSGNLTGIVA